MTERHRASTSTKLADVVSRKHSCAKRESLSKHWALVSTPNACLQLIVLVGISEILSLIMGVAFGWPDKYFAWMRVASSTDLLVLVRTPVLFYFGFALGALVVWATVTNMIFVGNIIVSGRYTHLWALRLLRVMMVLVVTIGYIPILRVMLVPFNCDMLLSFIGPDDYMSDSVVSDDALGVQQAINGANDASVGDGTGELGPGQVATCAHPAVLFMRVFSSLTLMVLVPGALFVRLTYFQDNPLSSSVLSRVSGRLDMLDTFNRTVLTAMATLNPNQPVALGLVAFILLLVQTSFTGVTLPYYRSVTNQVVVGAYGALTWLALGGIMFRIVRHYSPFLDERLDAQDPASDDWLLWQAAVYGGWLVSSVLVWSGCTLWVRYRYWMLLQLAWLVQDPRAVGAVATSGEPGERTPTPLEPQRATAGKSAQDRGALSPNVSVNTEQGSPNSDSFDRAAVSAGAPVPRIAFAETTGSQRSVTDEDFEERGATESDLNQAFMLDATRGGGNNLFLNNRAASQLAHGRDVHSSAADGSRDLQAARLFGGRDLAAATARIVFGRDVHAAAKETAVANSRYAAAGAQVLPTTQAPSPTHREAAPAEAEDSKGRPPLHGASGRAGAARSDTEDSHDMHPMRSISADHAALQGSARRVQFTGHIREPSPADEAVEAIFAMTERKAQTPGGVNGGDSMAHHRSGGSASSSPPRNRRHSYASPEDAAKVGRRERKQALRLQATSSRALDGDTPHALQDPTLSLMTVTKYADSARPTRTRAAAVRMQNITGSSNPRGTGCSSSTGPSARRKLGAHHELLANYEVLTPPAGCCCACLVCCGCGCGATYCWFWAITKWLRGCYSSIRFLLCGCKARSSTDSAVRSFDMRRRADTLPRKHAPTSPHSALHNAMHADSDASAQRLLRRPDSSHSHTTHALIAQREAGMVSAERNCGGARWRRVGTMTLGAMCDQYWLFSSDIELLSRVLLSPRVISTSSITQADIVFRAGLTLFPDSVFLRLARSTFILLHRTSGVEAVSLLMQAKRLAVSSSIDLQFQLFTKLQSWRSVKQASELGEALDSVSIMQFEQLFTEARDKHLQAVTAMAIMWEVIRKYHQTYLQEEQGNNEEDEEDEEGGVEGQNQVAAAGTGADITAPFSRRGGKADEERVASPTPHGSRVRRDSGVQPAVFNTGRDSPSFDEETPPSARMNVAPSLGVDAAAEIQRGTGMPVPGAGAAHFPAAMELVSSGGGGFHSSTLLTKAAAGRLQQDSGSGSGGFSTVPSMVLPPDSAASERSSSKEKKRKKRRVIYVPRDRQSSIPAGLSRHKSVTSRDVAEQLVMRMHMALAAGDNGPAQSLARKQSFGGGLGQLFSPSFSLAPGGNDRPSSGRSQRSQRSQRSSRGSGARRKLAVDGAVLGSPGSVPPPSSGGESADGRRPHMREVFTLGPQAAHGASAPIRKEPYDGEDDMASDEEAALLQMSQQEAELREAAAAAVNVQVAHLLHVIYTATTEADNAYVELIKGFSSSPVALKSYGLFLLHVIGDSDLAHRVLDKAVTTQEAQMVLARGEGALQQGVGGTVRMGRNSAGGSTDNSALGGDDDDDAHSVTSLLLLAASRRQRSGITRGLDAVAVGPSGPVAVAQGSDPSGGGAMGGLFGGDTHGGGTQGSKYSAARASTKHPLASARMWLTRFIMTLSLLALGTFTANEVLLQRTQDTLGLTVRWSLWRNTGQQMFEATRDVVLYAAGAAAAAQPSPGTASIPPLPTDGSSTALPASLSNSSAVQTFLAARSGLAQITSEFLGLHAKLYEDAVSGASSSSGSSSIQLGVLQQWRDPIRVLHVPSTASISIAASLTYPAGTVRTVDPVGTAVNGSAVCSLVQGTEQLPVSLWDWGNIVAAQAAVWAHTVTTTQVRPSAECGGTYTSAASAAAGSGGILPFTMAGRNAVATRESNVQGVTNAYRERDASVVRVAIFTSGALVVFGFLLVVLIVTVVFRKVLTLVRFTRRQMIAVVQTIPGSSVDDLAVKYRTIKRTYVQLGHTYDADRGELLEDQLWGLDPSKPGTSIDLSAGVGVTSADRGWDEDTYEAPAQLMGAGGEKQDMDKSVGPSTKKYIEAIHRHGKNKHLKAEADRELAESVARHQQGIVLMNAAWSSAKAEDKHIRQPSSQGASSAALGSDTPARAGMQGRPSGMNEWTRQQQRAKGAHSKATEAERAREKKVWDNVTRDALSSIRYWMCFSVLVLLMALVSSFAVSVAMVGDVDVVVGLTATAGERAAHVISAYGLARELVIGDGAVLSQNDAALELAAAVNSASSLSAEVLELQSRLSTGVSYFAAATQSASAAPSDIDFVDVAEAIGLGSNLSASGSAGLASPDGRLQLSPIVFGAASGQSGTAQSISTLMNFFLLAASNLLQCYAPQLTGSRNLNACAFGSANFSAAYDSRVLLALNDVAALGSQEQLRLMSRLYAGSLGTSLFDGLASDAQRYDLRMNDLRSIGLGLLFGNLLIICAVYYSLRNIFSARLVSETVRAAQLVALVPVMAWVPLELVEEGDIVQAAAEAEAGLLGESKAAARGSSKRTPP